MGILSWLGFADKAIDVIDEFVEDKDERNRLTAGLQRLKEEVYIVELQTKTIPWVDALHKMGRQIISLLSMLVGAWLAYTGKVDPQALFAILAPAGIYNGVKGRGR